MRSKSLLMFILFLTGCRGFLIESDPPGATIIIDDRMHGRKTPAHFRARQFYTGEHTITVVKDGYVTTTPPQTMIVEYDIVKIVGSIIFPPALIHNFLFDRWKSATQLPRKFVLKEGPTSSSPSTQNQILIPAKE